jgi:adenylate kinase family enzyme
VKRVVILGPGGSGKSTFAAELGALSGLPVVELDHHFWSPALEPLSPEQWAAVQGELASGPEWILDGDLGPYDVIEVRLRRADTVIILDFALWRCTWRSIRRSRQRLDFWRWLIAWHRTYRPALLEAISRHAPDAAVHLPNNPRELRRLQQALMTAARE